MAASGPSWGLVATVADPAPLIAAMVAHHLAEGAAEVLLFLDRPDPELRGLIGHLPQVRFIDCDADHWARLDGKRPQALGRRQFLNASHAYRMATVDWLLHCDSDEFLWTGATLARELAALPDRVDCLILPNVERVFARDVPQTSLYQGLFRRPRKRFNRLGRFIYGDDRLYLNRGVTAYSIGKALTRTGRDLDVSIHAAQKKPEGRKPVLVRSRRTLILHFDGMTQLHWKVKLLRKAANTPPEILARNAPSRRRTIRWMQANAENPGAVDRLCRAVLTISPKQKLLLKLTGLLTDLRFSPEAAIASYCPAALVTPEAFDADLRRMLPEFAARAEPVRSGPQARGVSSGTA